MTKPLSRLFGDGFRIFFLAAGVFGIVSVLYWETWLGIHALGGMVTRHPFAPPPHLWHAHEMVFGYAGAALGGFFLTAVPNWTGTKAAGPGYVFALAALWLSGRLVIWFSAGLPPLLVGAVDLAFLPVLAAKILTQLFRRPKPQNLMFLGLLSLLWLSNLTVHAAWAGLGDLDAGTGIRAGLLSVCAMIAVLGGRVTPAFTRNAMTRAGRNARLPRSLGVLEVSGVALAILVPVTLLSGVDQGTVGALVLAAGLAQLLRLGGWRTGWTLNQPILWSLHLAFAMLGTGYAMLGLSWLGYGSEVAALHVLGIGGVGGMTLAVMSRAILGHTGRPLTAPAPLAAAFALMAGAALVRWLGSSVAVEHYFAAMLISGAGWMAAQSLFVATLLPAILGARASA